MQKQNKRDNNTNDKPIQRSEKGREKVSQERLEVFKKGHSAALDHTPRSRLLKPETCLHLSLLKIIFRSLV